MIVKLQDDDRSTATASRVAPTRHLAEADPASGEAELPTTDAAHLLPAELLEHDELIILLIKPSAWYILLGSLRSLIVLGVFFFGLMWLQRSSMNPGLSHRDIVLLAAGCAIVRLFWQFLEWLSRIYVLTDRRVIRVQGVTSISVFQTPLQNVTLTELTANALERVCGLGTVTFTMNKADAGQATWDMLARPADVHEIVQQTLEKYR